MIEYVKGNLLEADAEALVNTVNTVGVMGKGVALQFRRAFPENYDAYVAAVARKDVVPGRMFTWESDRPEGPRYIINFPTKRHWRGRSRLQDIEAGLDDLRRALIERDVRSAALPALGCGLGGLDWSDVRERMRPRSAISRFGSWSTRPRPPRRHARCLTHQHDRSSRRPAQR